MPTRVSWPAYLSRRRHRQLGFAAPAALLLLPWLLAAPAAAQFPFTNQSVASGLDLGGRKDAGLTWGDLNADGCLDLLVNTLDAVVQSRVFLQYRTGPSCTGSFDDVTDCIVTGLNGKPAPPPGSVAQWTERSALWGDVDNDGDLDLQVNTTGASLTDLFAAEIFLNNGAGSAPGAACGYDPDNNATIDPVPWAVFRFGGNVAIELGVIGAVGGNLQTINIDGINFEHVSFSDYDKDGDLDWVLDNHDRGVVVMRNVGNWTTGAPAPLAQDVAQGLPFCLPPAMCTAPDGDYGTSADLDRDGDVDHIARKPAGVFDLFINDGAGPKYYDDTRAGVNIDASANGESFKGGVSPCDFDSDGDFDFFWTDNGTNQIWEQTGRPLTPVADGTGTFVAANEPAASVGFSIPLAENADDAACGDYDNDGDLDLLVTTTIGDYLFRNRFVELGGSLNLPADRLQFTCVMGPNAACTTNTTVCTLGTHLGCGDSEAAVFGDVNRDGDVDLVINHNPTNEFWRNTTNDLDYLMVQALWDIDGLAGGVTRDAIGATLQLYDCGGRLVAPLLEVSGGRGQGAQDPLVVHFGLEFGSGYPYVVRVEYVGGAVVERAVVPSSLAPGYQMITIRSTDPTDTSSCLTPAVVGPLSGRALGDGVELSFETAAEVGTLGFWLFRSDDQGELEPVSSELLLAVPPAPQGSRYRLFDRGATPPYERYRYHLVELETDGREQFHGPFSVAWAEAGASRESGVAGGDAARSVQAASTIALEGSPKRVPRSTTRLRSAGTATTTSQGIGIPLALKLAVEQRGLYRVTAGQIAGGLGLPSDEVHTRLLGYGFALELQGEAVAWRPSADAESLVFVGDAPASIYTSRNVYWLRTGSGLPMATVSGEAPPAGSGIFSDGFESGDLSAWQGGGGSGAADASAVTADAVFEKNLFAATALATDPESDYWYWHVLSAGHPTLGSASFELEPEHPEPGSGAAITVELQGASPSSNSYLVEAELNGVPLGEFAWQGSARASAQFEAPPGTLRSGDNVLVLTGLRPSGVSLSIVYVDRVHLRYERRLVAVGDRLELAAQAAGQLQLAGFATAEVAVLELSDPLHPVWVEVTPAPSGGSYGFSFLAEPGARYLAAGSGAVAEPVGTPFLGGPSPLVTAGWAEYLVITDSSLRAQAQRLVDRRASQGLAAGLLEVERIYDELNHGQALPGAIRQLLELTEPNEGGERFVVLVGKGHFDYRGYQNGDAGWQPNLMPPLLLRSAGGLVASDHRYVDYSAAPRTVIGRIPARDAAELATYIDKLIAFEDGAGAWTRTVLLASDDAGEQGDFGFAPFEHSTGVLRSLLPPAYQSFEVSLEGAALSDARSELFAGLDAGAAVFNYLGHGGVDRLAAEGLLRSEDVALLHNFDRAPIVLGLTCNIGRFDLPTFATLGEGLVLGSTGGATAVFASAALSSNPEAVALGVEVFGQVFGGSHARLGSALRAARESFAGSGDAFDLLPLYNLLGDPALLLP